MSRRARTTVPGHDVYGQLAKRLQRMARDEHKNHGSGAERFTVRNVTPLRIEHMGSDLVLEDGDPDFTIGAHVRQYMLNYTLVPGDQMWCLREGQDWHALDVIDPGNQRAWEFADTAD